MPISKNGNAYYTKEQYRQAKYAVSALEYAQRQGYELVRQGAYYHMKDHDSMIFAPNGSWFWNSRGVHGGAIEFCMYYEGKTIAEAVLTLSGDREPAAKIEKAPEKTEKPEKEPAKVFELPERSKDYRRLFAYLCQTRGISKDVVMDMLQRGLLYEGVSHIRGREHHNAVFVYYSPEGEPMGAFQRGLNSQVPYKGDVPGSNKKYGWLLRGQAPVTGVCVFEAAIDAASHACLTDVPHVDRLSLEGLDPDPLRNYLKQNPQVRDVLLMLDNDQWGQQASQRILLELSQQGYSVAIVPPAYGKDWNDTLLEMRAQQANAETPQEAPEATEIAEEQLCL